MREYRDEKGDWICIILRCSGDDDYDAAAKYISWHCADFYIPAVGV